MKKTTMMILSHILTALIACAVTLFVAVSGLNAGYSKLEHLEDIIDQNYIEEYDKTEIEDAAAQAMIGALGDRWSYYIPADEYASYQEQMANAYVGIGVTIQQRSDGQGLDVIQVSQGGPAEEVGILPGDRIVSVDGKSILAMELEAVRSMIRGEEGTRVSITVLRGEEEKEFSLVRKSFQTPVAIATLLPDNIGLVTIVNFDTRCANETVAAIESLLEQGATKLIFDVRNNPGGYKSELVQVLDYLLPEGLIFRCEYQNGKVENDYSDQACLDVPMAVLVNGNSYSAAEFFAAALNEYDKAVIVGQATTGKGYVQNVYQMNDGSAVGISIGRYCTPNGVSLEGVGITPEIPVDVTEEIASQIYYGTLEPGDDPQIQAAVDALLGH